MISFMKTNNEENPENLRQLMQTFNDVQALQSKEIFQMMLDTYNLILLLKSIGLVTHIENP
jgi:hypothetical protein